MSRMKRLLALGAALLPLSVAHAILYTWDAGGSDDDWDTCANWNKEGLAACYPQATTDSALVPVGAWDVVLINETIHDLDVEGSTDFTGGVALTVLHLDSELTLTAGVVTPITVTMGSNGVIVTD